MKLKVQPSSSLQSTQKAFTVIDNWKRYRQCEENKRKNLISEIPAENFCISTFKAFAKNSSIHAVHYLTEESMRMIEKCFWLLIVMFGSLAMAYCCLLLSNRFRSSLTSTVFESTSFKISEIPFPSVTLCNNNRLNYNKTNDAVNKFVANHTKKEQDVFVRFLYILQNMDFGSFDEFSAIEKDYNGEFDHLNITVVYKFMMHECESFLVKCKWHEKPIDCCKIFSRQITEYGLCYSFNSYTNDGTQFINRSGHFPWRSASSGRDSALEVSMRTHPETKVERENSQTGIMAIVQHPWEHPSMGQFVTVKSIASLIIKPTAFTTSDDVMSLHPADRQCYYDVSLSLLLFVCDFSFFYSKKQRN